MKGGGGQSKGVLLFISLLLMNVYRPIPRNVYSVWAYHNDSLYNVQSLLYTCSDGVGLWSVFYLGDCLLFGLPIPQHYGL